ncbi:hypothetical protein D9758_012403 [Tetrapyrgos nigripes]|uniref:DDE Tnp4 domain-containing protein n=1 Tax=Tetrapyrgos nigripes TaxID=182062 RepID=A0A8H5D6K3_9AGAR|nr:hypothetical protein D9758_012403 [Tetrapyrgos nigripes]
MVCYRPTTRNKQIAAFLMVTAAGAAATSQRRRPFLSGIFIGQMWLEDMLKGRNERFRRMFGMNKRVFHGLVQELSNTCGLKDSRYVSAEEKVAIFLHTMVSTCSNRELQEHFQRGGDTILHYFNQVLNMLCGAFYHKYVKLPSTDIPEEISSNPKFSGYFDDCIGAIDGCHFHACVSADAIPHFRNCKGFISQNVLAGCTFGMEFCYMLSRWEGSTADGQGKIYLADAGFPSCDVLLVPYRGVHYHMKEPRDPKELYNLRHAQLRNVIERIFGVDKRRFKILTVAPEYPFQTQVKLPPAAAALHNFIHRLDPTDNAEKLNHIFNAATD